MTSFLLTDQEDLKETLEEEALLRGRSAQAEVNHRMEAIVVTMRPGPDKDAALYWMAWADILGRRLQLAAFTVEQTHAYYRLAHMPPAGRA